MIACIPIISARPEFLTLSIGASWHPAGGHIRFDFPESDGPCCHLRPTLAHDRLITEPRVERDEDRDVLVHCIPSRTSSSCRYESRAPHSIPKPITASRSSRDW